MFFILQILYNNHIQIGVN